jgi:hypothetical protein
MLLFYSIQPALSADKEEPVPSEKTDIQDDATEQSQEGTYEDRREYIQRMMEEQRKKRAGSSSLPDYKNQKEKSAPQTEEQASGETSPSSDQEEATPSKETGIKNDATEQSQEGTYEDRRRYIQRMMEEQRKKRAGSSSRPDYKNQKEKSAPQTEEQASGETSPSETGQE